MATLRRLCVYCASSARVDERYRAAATRLGTLLAESGIGLVFGGGRVGLMGLLADAALAGGGEVIGVIPQHLVDREVAHAGVTQLVVVGSMHERKQRMFDLADGFATLPGGFGTLDETIEMITWRLLGVHDKPILIVDVAGYWRPLRHLFDHLVAAGFAAPAAWDLFRVVEQVEDVLPTIAALPQPAAPGSSDLT